MNAAHRRCSSGLLHSIRFVLAQLALPVLWIGRDDGAVTNISDDHVQLHFRMEVDQDGWPPASVESLWAVALDDRTVRLDNTPWFVRGVASGDIIQVSVDEDGLR